MNTEPLKKYIAGRDALKEGKKAEALSLLASSLSSTEPTEMMKSSFDKLLDLHDVALTIIVHRTKEE